MPVLIGEVLIKFLDDAISPELYDEMEKHASKYTQENAEKQLIEIYQGYIDVRTALFQTALLPVLPIVTPTTVPTVDLIDPVVQKNNLDI